jgi:hypothetical protein
VQGERLVERNSSVTARFDILAKTDLPIDAIVRHSLNGKLDFPAVASVELGFSEKYGYQVILVAYGLEGKFPVTIETDYPINRPRIEVAIPAAHTAKFLQQLAINSRKAYQIVRAWERSRGF